eukprot:2111421-Amphidinium_carterae.1
MHGKSCPYVPPHGPHIRSIAQQSRMVGRSARWILPTFNTANASGSVTPSKWPFLSVYQYWRRNSFNLGYGQALRRSIPFVVAKSTWIIFPH